MSRMKKSLIAFTLLFVLMGTLIFYAITVLNDSAKWVVHTYNVIGQGNKLQLAMIDQETGLRGFLLNGKEEYLEPYNAGLETFDRILAQLKQTVDDNPAQVQNLIEINETAQEWRTNIANKYIKMRRNIRLADKPKLEIMSNVESRAGKRMMDGIRASLDKSSLSALHKETLLVNMINMETGLRGFLLSGNEIYLDPYKEGYEATPSILSKSGATKELKKEVYAWISFAEKLIELQRKINESDSHSDLMSIHGTGEGKQTMDKIRVQIASFISNEKTLLVGRENYKTETTKFIYISVSVLFVILLSLLVVIFRGQQHQ